MSAKNNKYGPYGRDDLMAVAAVRYCLGRMTYIVGDCRDWLFAIWDDLSPGVQQIIQRDVEDEIERDTRARTLGCEYGSLGQSLDREVWLEVRKRIRSAQTNRIK